MRSGVGLAILLATVPVVALAQSERIKNLNRGFAGHVRNLSAGRGAEAETILRSLTEDYVGEDAEAFVPDSLGLLYPKFQDAIDAFDEDQYHAAGKLFQSLISQDDPYLSANAGYFYARSLVERGLLEEAEAFLNGVVTPSADLGQRTPYAGHFWFVQGFCQHGNLRFDAAAESLKTIARLYADAPEPVRVGAEQLLLEIERREIGTLDEVSSLMGYAAGRLSVADSAERVRERQADAIKLLDELIKKAEEKEKKQCSGGGSGQQGKGQGSGRGAGRSPRERSEAQAGAGQIGDLRPAEKADPGEMWGRLPPAEREKILQSLRDRFPSRYRELVEQYYRTLAEDK